MDAKFLEELGKLAGLFLIGWVVVMVYLIIRSFVVFCWQEIMGRFRS